MSSFLSTSNNVLFRVTDQPQVDGRGLAQQLGLSLSTIPPKFTQIRKRYNLKVKVMNTGAIRRGGNGVGGTIRQVPTNLDEEQDDTLKHP